MAIVIGEPNTLPHIDGIFAFLSKDDKGNEGLCAFQYKPGHWLPLVAADEKRLASLMPVAQEIARHSEHDVVLVKFSTREEVKVFTKGV